MIYDNQDLARDEMVLTLKQVEDMYLAMNRERVEFDDIRDAVADSEAGKWSGIEYQEAVSAFQKALGGCQDSELYIYSGSLYMRDGIIGIREISSDRRLIEMIKRQPKSRSLLRRRDQPLKYAEGYISEGLSDTQYVKLSYIKETIRRMDAYVKDVFEKLEFTDEEMKMCINYLMNKEWD